MVSTTSGVWRVLKKKRSLLVGDVNLQSLERAHMPLWWSPCSPDGPRPRWLGSWEQTIIWKHFEIDLIDLNSNFTLKPKIKTAESLLVPKRWFAQNNFQNFKFYTTRPESNPLLNANCLFNNTCSFHLGKHGFFVLCLYSDLLLDSQNII